MRENTLKKLIDARTIEATKKKLSGKLACIAKNLGSPIVSEVGIAQMLPDFWENVDEIATYDDSTTTSCIGWVYDSLKLGVNMEIVLHSLTERISLIRVTLNGNLVFLEEEGVLQGYAPDQYWETHINVLYEKAKSIEDQRAKIERGKEKSKAEKRGRTFLEKFKMLWGLK